MVERERGGERDVWRALIEQPHLVSPVLIANINKCCETKRIKMNWYLLEYMLGVFPIQRITMWIFVLPPQHSISQRACTRNKPNEWICGCVGLCLCVYDNWPETGNVYTVSLLFWQNLWSGYLLFVLVLCETSVRKASICVCVWERQVEFDLLVSFFLSIFHPCRCAASSERLMCTWIG